MSRYQLAISDVSCWLKGWFIEAEIAISMVLEIINSYKYFLLTSKKFSSYSFSVTYYGLINKRYKDSSIILALVVSKSMWITIIGSSVIGEIKLQCND